VLLVSSLTSYFMDSYNVIIDESMIQNTMYTDMAESMEAIIRDSFKKATRVPASFRPLLWQKGQGALSMVPSITAPGKLS